VYKVSHFLGEDQFGPRVIPLFGPADSYFEKTAAPTLLTPVVRYIERLKPTNGSQYVLVNAMGATEYYGSNINGDAFSEASLIHRPDDWRDDPVLDRIRGKEWPYGFPTFYDAHPFAHHRNKDPKRAFGEVELAAWHDHMHRVELVCRIDKDKCEQFGGVPVWDRISAGQFPDVSMGCFTAGTLVTMADGTRRPIESISVGDCVLTHRGRARAVKEVHRRPYAGTLYSIKAEAHQTIRCTRQHPFYAVTESAVKEKDYHANLRWCVDKRIRPSWAHAECLDLDTYLLEPVPCSERSLSMDPSRARAFARLLGYYLAEGHLLRNKAGKLCGIELTTHNDDPVHAEIDQLCVKFGTKNPPSVHARANSENSTGIYVFDAELAELCQEHAGSYSDKKKLSETVMNWQKDLQFEMLGAYANGDGCGPAEGSLKFSTSSVDLSWQLLQLLSRKGMPASHGVLHHSATGLSQLPTTEYVVHVGKQWSSVFSTVCAKVKPSEVLKSKHSRIFAIEQDTDDMFVVTPIRDITAFYAEVEVYNLEVEEDESYVVEGLAVHNCKVPFDTCSICLDWKLYREAAATFDKAKHKHPGMAILEFHKKLKEKNGTGIRGLSITRKDYCEHAAKQMNRILKDGRKVWVYNDYPRFFDISFVFIGADKTAKMMLKIAEGGVVYSIPSAKVAEDMGYTELWHPESSTRERMEKAASAEDEWLKMAFLGKNARLAKRSEIVKDVVPDYYKGKAVELATSNEKDLPKDLLDSVATSSPLENILSTSGSLGMVLRPREFQRIVLVQIGRKDMADDLDKKNITFPKTDEKSEVPMGPQFFSKLLAGLLRPFFEGRSALAPALEGRLVMSTDKDENKKTKTSSQESELLHKIGSAYNGYRSSLMDLVAHAQPMIGSATDPSDDLHKVASSPVDEVFTPLSVAYLQEAFWNEVPVSGNGVKTA